MEIKTVGVIGAGQMGSGIAQVMAQAGYAVRLHDVAPGAVERAIAQIGDNFDRQISKGKADAATKATTLGVGALLLASVIFFTSSRPGLSLHEVTITLFLFMTAPVSAHLLVRAGLHQKVDSRTQELDKDHGHGTPGGES